MTDLLARILVPLDGSELADRILEQVRRLLLRRDGAVTLLRVLSPLALEREKRPGEPMELARVQLERLAQALRAQGAQVTCEVAVGEPADRIHAFELEHRPSLIAMATHGRTGLARWTRGSVAERLLRVSRAPLLLANPFCAEKEELRFRRILVPLDGSERSAGILPLV
ncbi:MAG TPA: universal stress protein, partial [Planctomycetota bacterium]|nr:universal stress protein [Planctomycetota bacterium]